MKIHTGAGDTVWAVTRCGPGGRQVAAATSKAVSVWEPDGAEPVQVLPAENPAWEHSGLSTSPDGQWLLGHGHGRLWCWRLGPSGWQPSEEQDSDGLCAARFVEGPATIGRAVLHGDAGVQVQVSRQPLPEGVGWSPEVVGTFSAEPCSLVSAARLFDRHYLATDLSGLVGTATGSVIVWDVD